MSVPPDPMPRKDRQSTQKHYRQIIANPGLIPSVTSEEKQFVGEQRIDDPMSPLSPCTETDSQNASPSRSTISLQDGSITVSRARHFMFCGLTFISFLFFRNLHPSRVINPWPRRFPPIYDLMNIMNCQLTLRIRCLREVGSTCPTFAEKTNCFAW